MRVCLFPDLPIENWKSMDLYANKLAAGLRAVADDGEFELVAVKPSPRHHRYIARYVIYPQRAKSYRADVYHVLDHSYGHLVRALDATRTVVTVHDVYPLRLVNERADSWRERLRNRLLRWVMTQMQRAGWLIADSHFTKRELLELTDFPEARISVVHLGVEEAFFQPVSLDARQQFRHALRVPEQAPLLLHVGSCDPRKNIPTLLRGFKQWLSESHVDGHLLQIGGRFTDDHRRLIAALDIASRVHQRPQVSLDDLRCAYQAADVLLLPSTYEGFGLTVLEAMASATPVIASHVGPLPEVLGDAGLLVAPINPMTLAEAVARVLDDTTLRNQLIERGRLRAMAFTWTETARQTLTVYQRIHAEHA